jgi:hypothetical protein
MPRRLSSPERRANILASKARWRDANREYYRLQKRVHAGLPDSKVKRKAMRQKMRRASGDPPVTPPKETTGHTLWDFYDPSAQVPRSDPSGAILDPLS